MTADVGTVEYSPTGWRWPDYLLAAIGLSALTFAFMQIRELATLALVGFSFFYLMLGLRRPAYIVAAVLIIELTIKTYTLSVLPAPLPGLRYGPIILGTIVAALAVPNMDPKPTLGPGAARVLIPAIAFIAIAMLATSIGVRPAVTLEVGRYYGFGFVLMLLIALLIRDEADLRMVAKVVLGVFIFSALASVSQHSPWVPDFISLAGEVRDERTVGLTRSPVSAANTLVMGFLATFAMMTALRLSSFWGLAFLVFTILIGPGWYYTGTRSALFAAAVGVVLLLLMLRGRVLAEVLVAVLLFGGVLGYFLVSSGNRYTQTSSTNASAAGRVVKWKVGAAVAMDNFMLGTGYGTFTDVAPDYLSEVDVSEHAGWLDIESALQNQVHNDFLRVWQEFGIIGLAAFLVVAGLSSVNLLRAYFRTDSPWMKGISLAVFAALVGYLVNSFFHNSLNVSFALWGLAGFSIAIAKVTAARTEDGEERVLEPQTSQPGFPR